MKKSIEGAVLSIALLAQPAAHAEAKLSGLSVIIDKPSYNTTYSIGVEALVDPTSSPVSAISVSHEPGLSGAIGSWTLSQQTSNPSSWWNWADGRPMQATGPLDGSLSITLTGSDGHTTTIDAFQFQPSVELDIPTMTVSLTPHGYHVSTQPITNADYYNLWLWDPVERRYPSSQQVSNIADLQDVSFAGLVSGRTYSLFLIANNRFSGGSLNASEASVFRAYTLTSLTYIAAPVPEPSTGLLIGVGLSLLIAWRRRLWV